MNNEDYLIEQYTLEEKEYNKIADLLSESFLSDPAAIEEGASILFSGKTIKLIFGSPTVKKNYFVRAVYKKTNDVVLVQIKQDLHQMIPVEQSQASFCPSFLLNLFFYVGDVQLTKQE